MDLKLNGHVAVVTGGASGIGKAIAEGFLAEGCQVAIWDRNVTGVDERFLALSVDVADLASVQAATRETEAALGAIDHLVHAAAVGSGKIGMPFTNLTPADWPRVLEVNVVGTANVAHTVAPSMVARGSGTLVFVASVAGQIGSSTDPPYSASKAANINFAQCLARDLAPRGIRVNSVCPGMVRTPLAESVWRAWHAQQPPGARTPYDEWAAAKIKANIPLGRWQRADDVADMVVFLSSPRAGEVTGQTINVDGGYVMHW